jgi:FkbM family methyltransferase
MRKEQMPMYFQSLIKHPNKFVTAIVAHILNRPMTVQLDFKETGSFAAVLPDAISRYLYLFKQPYEPEVHLFLNRSLSEGDNVLVCGAHIGYHALAAKNIIGDSGEMWCYEPTPRTFEVLCENIKPHQNTIAYESAITSREGWVELIDFGWRRSAWNSIMQPRLTESDKLSWGYGYRPVQVDATTIDCAVDGKFDPRLILLDIENAEYDALKGAENTIDQFRPAIIFEIGDLGRNRENSTLRCIKFLEKSGYSFWEVTNGQLQSHEICASYPYYANLLAVPESTQ